MCFTDRTEPSQKRKLDELAWKLEQVCGNIDGGAGRFEDRILTEGDLFIQRLTLGVIGGGPTFLGTVIGYHFVSPTLSVLFLTLAAGAIIYVISEMTKAGGRIGYKEFATIGVFVGFVLGWSTDLILTAAGA